MDKNMKILVVDDFAQMRMITKKLLTRLGFTNVDEADDGSTALPMLENGGYDFLMTDWNMPGMPGIELLKAVRADPQLSDLPVLMLTSEARRDQIMIAAAAGVDGYMVKPFTQEALENKLDRVFARRAVA